MIFFLSKFWSNKQLVVQITFHLKGQFWSMTCQLRSYGRIVGLVFFKYEHKEGRSLGFTILKCNITINTFDNFQYFIT